MINNHDDRHCLQLPHKIVGHLRLFTESDLKCLIGILSAIDPATGKAHLTLAILSQITGLSVRSVNKSILRLTAFGYVKYHPIKGKTDDPNIEVMHTFPGKGIDMAKSEVSYKQSHTLPDTSPKIPLIKEKNILKPETSTQPTSMTNQKTGIKNILGKKRESEREETPYKPVDRKSLIFLPHTQEDMLACEVAEQLGDTKLIPLLLFYCQKYPEPLIQKAVAEVKSYPEEKIRKSRLALFIHLLHKYDNQAKSGS
jgi:hypothetical protein